MSAADGHWPGPPRLPPLAAGAAQVWRVDLAVSAARAERLEAALSAEERRRAARYRHARDRRRFVAARASLRCLLAAHMDAEPAEVAFVYGVNGKPALASGGPSFNLSHSHDLALIALTRGRDVGIDVERIRPLTAAPRIAARLWTGREAAALEALAGDERLAAFHATWTRKEAVVKGLGVGLSGRLDGFEVPTDGAPTSRSLRVAGRDGRAEAWWLSDLRPAPGYVGALALRGCEGPVACWAWPSERDRAASRPHRAAPGSLPAALSASA